MAARGGEEPNYLCFTSANQYSCVIVLSENGTPPPLSVEYRMNKGQWYPYTFGNGVEIRPGDVMEMRNSQDTISTQISSSSSNYRIFTKTGSGAIHISGNVMSLLDKNCLADEVGEYGMYHLFYNLKPIRIEIEITALILGNSACEGMFSMDISATGNVYSKAVTLGTNCYKSIMQSCRNINSLHFATLNPAHLAFYQNDSCSYFYIDANTPPTIGNTTITGLKSNCIIYVPAGSVAAYKAAQYWSERAAYIQANPNT